MGRLAAVVTGLVVLCLSVVATVLGAHARAQSALDHELSLEASQHLDGVEAYFERSRAISLILAQNPAFADFHDAPGTTQAKIEAGGPRTERLNAALAFIQELYPGRIAEACFIDAHGQEIARVTNGFAALPPQLSPDESANPFFAPTLALPVGRVYQARPYVSPDAEVWVISNSTRIPTGTGSPAVVHFEVTLDSFRSTPKEADHIVSIVDAESGATLVDSRLSLAPPTATGRGHNDELRALAALPGPRGVATIGERRVAYQHVTSVTGNANTWIVAVSEPDLPAPWSRGLEAGSLIMMLAALLTIALAGISLRSYQRSLRRAALHDGLTGLPNRALLSDRLAQALRAAERHGGSVAVLVIDLDRFKEVNDSLGHHLGDRLLQHVSARLRGSVDRGVLVARLGGDEFAVLMPSITEFEEVSAAAERILHGLHGRFDVDGIGLGLEASIGAAISPQHGRQGMDLMRCADIAMYVAKRRKAGAVVYEEQFDVHASDGLEILGDLRSALDCDDQILLHYQPKVDVPDGELKGVEALVRWQHPERGLLMPGDFIPIAENTALIQRLTDRVLQLSARQARRWLDAGTPIPIAVNLSTRCLLDDTLPIRVLDILDAHGLPASLLNLEITETAIMADPARARNVLAALHGAGIALSIDDFGTGYSSMAYLKDLPVAELKVDRCFVKDMSTSRRDAALVRSAIDLAHSLGLLVVAEGVEDQQTLDDLNRFGCDQAQGYYLSRPVPADQIDAWRAQGRLPAVRKIGTAAP